MRELVLKCENNPVVCRKKEKHSFKVMHTEAISKEAT